MKPFIDLTRHAFTRRHGDIRVYGTWMGAENRPALVLIPSHAPLRAVTPCVVPMDNAWIWSEEMGEPQHVALACFQFAQALGLDQYNCFTLIRLAGIIRDELGELLNIPPKPPTDNVTGEVSVTCEGKTRSQKVLADV
ncbi:MAG: hypothetical protein ACRC5A_01320 [Enterobacteriaceae bacterium]